MCTHRDSRDETRIFSYFLKLIEWPENCEESYDLHIRRDLPKITLFGGTWNDLLRRFPPWARLIWCQSCGNKRS